MIMYARALYRSFKVKWIGKVYFPTHVLFIINTVIRRAHDRAPALTFKLSLLIILLTKTTAERLE